jgi:hypothetical protein
MQMTATQQDKLARIGKDMGYKSIIIPDWHGMPVAPANTDELVNLGGYLGTEDGRVRQPISAEPLYDYLEIPANSAQRAYSLFVDVEAASGKTLAHTNSTTNGRLDAPESFVVERIGICFSPTTDPLSRAIFCDSYMMSLDVLKRSYFRCPVSLAFNVASSTDTESPLHAQFKLDRPVLITSGVNFQVSLRGQPPKQHEEIKLWVVLQGAYQQGFC